VLGIPIILQNFIPIGKGVSFPRMRDFAHHFVYSSTVWEGMFFLSPPAKTPTPTFMENIKIKGRSHYARMRTYPTSCEHCLVVSSRVCWNRTGNNDDANSIRIRACVIAFSQFYWHCPQSMRSRVYETLRCPSVCLSQRVPQQQTLLLWSDRQGISIDCCTAHSSAAGECGQCHVVSVRSS